MRIDFIRHGRTGGNAQRRYIGSTDEELSPDGISELLNISYPPCELLIASPMRRCLQTAEIIYPDKKPMICEELRECDFGDFEGKNYIELSSDSRYQRWIESGGEGVFPNGERPADFKKRCIDGFLKCMGEVSEKKAVTFVVHGGTIMAVLEYFAVPHQSYYDWHTDNGHGYITDFDGKKITVTEKI